jgi:NADPH:quinone reductase-like Zn-dependent oxidoreductase
MKAIRIHEHGGVERLRIEELEAPQPGPGQILIAVRAAALNPGATRRASSNRLAAP